MSEPDLPLVEELEVDGVPVFWTDVDGPRSASLMFRVGRADEPANQGGVTHLVEHLALAPLAQQDYHHNGFVAPLRTVFHATGTDAQLIAFVGAVTASLRALPLDRILMERRILGHEAIARGPSHPNLLRWFRYGYAGHGLVGAEEIGLGWLGPKPVAEWAGNWFTRHNAALWWSGPPPGDLRIDLPEGQRRPTAPTPTVPGVAFPARIDNGGTGCSAGFVGSRSAATRIMQSVILRRLRQDLRFERGLIYDVGTDYEPLDGRSTHIAVGMDCTREDAVEVASMVLRVLTDLREHGATDEEIAREATTFVEGATQTGGRFGFLDGTAHDALLGHPRETAAEIVAEYQAVTPDAIAAVAAAALDTLLLLAPPGPYDDGTLGAYPSWSDHVVDGRMFRPSGWRILPSARPDRLIVGPTGVSWIGPSGLPNTVRYDDCVALRHWEGPVRELWGADGFRVVINAADWNRGASVVAEVDAAVSPAVVACDEHGVGALEAPKGAVGQAAGR